MTVRVVLSDRTTKSIFLLLGIGVLVPWNAFISAAHYFQGRICGAAVSDQFESWVGLLFNGSSVASLALLLWVWPWWIRRQRRHSCCGGGGAVRVADENEEDDLEQLQQQEQQQQPKSHSFWLVTVPLCFFLAVFVVTDLLVLVRDIAPTTFLAVTLVGIITCGCAVAFCQAGIVAAAGLVPAPLGIHPFVSGQAVGGVLVAAANLLSAAAEDPRIFWKEHCQRGNNSSSSTSNHTTTAANNTMARIQYDWVDSNWNNRTTTSAEKEPLSSLSASASADPTCLPYTSQDWDVFVYFLVGAVVLLCCIVGFSILERSSANPSTTRLQEEEEEYESVEVESQHGNDGAMEEFRDEPPPSPRSGLELSSSSHHQQQQEQQQQKHNATSTSTFEAVVAADTTDVLERQSYHGDDTEDDPDGIFRRLPSSDSDGLSLQSAARSHTSEQQQQPQSVLRAVKGPAFCIFFTFFVTLSLFPSWTSQLRSIHQCHSTFRLSNDLFTPFTFLLFNIGDLSGRLLAGRLQAARIRNLSAKLVVAACARSLFFPLLLLCVGGGGSDESHNHLSATGGGHDDERLQIQSDVYSLTVQSGLALSNGFLISLAFMHAPTLIPASPGSQEKSSEILTMALSLGLLFGSLFSFPVTKLAMEM